MAGLDPAIHVLLAKIERKNVDARDKPGHDDVESLRFNHTATNSATPATINTMPASSRADSGCLNE